MGGGIEVEPVDPFGEPVDLVRHRERPRRLHLGIRRACHQVGQGPRVRDADEERERALAKASSEAVEHDGVRAREGYLQLHFADIHRTEAGLRRDQPHGGVADGDGFDPPFAAGERLLVEVHRGLRRRDRAGDAPPSDGQQIHLDALEPAEAGAFEVEVDALDAQARLDAFLGELRDAYLRHVEDRADEREDRQPDGDPAPTEGHAASPQPRTSAGLRLHVTDSPSRP